MAPCKRNLKELAERYPISEIVGSPDRIEFIEDMNRLPGKEVNAFIPL